MMPTENYSRPAPVLIENGFSQGPPPRPPRPWKKILLSGVAAALVLGLGLGLLAKPDLASNEERAMTPVAQTPSPGGLDIVVNRAPPAPAPKSTGGKLEVLPERLAAAAPKPPPAHEPAYQQAAADTVGDLLPPARMDMEPAAQERPIDCADPADRQEARICRDIGFDRGQDY